MSFVCFVEMKDSFHKERKKWLLLKVELNNPTWMIMSVLKLPFAFLQRNTKNYSCTHCHSLFYREIRNFSCTQTAIRSFFTAKDKIWNCTKRPFRFFTTKHKILKTAPKRLIVFYTEIQNFESCTQMAIRIPHKEMRNLTIYHQFSFVS